MPVKLDIPTLPLPQARALALLSRSDATVAEVGGVVESDPALTTLLLRAANSAFSSPRVRIGTAQQAIVRVGLAEARHIVGASVMRKTFQRLIEAGLDVNELWRHLLACAVLAEATASSGRNRTDTFTAGLLHDVGRLAMAAQDPERYARVSEAARDGKDTMQSELREFGSVHTGWGVELGRAWRLPENVIEAIAFHHRDSRDETVLAVWEARRVSWALGIGDGLRSPPDEGSLPDSTALSRLGGRDALFERIDWYSSAIRGVSARTYGRQDRAIA